eukprot:SAG22_NODE_136_length_18095_cov_19.897255_18_plen_191_part_00
MDGFTSTIRGSYPAGCGGGGLAALTADPPPPSSSPSAAAADAAAAGSAPPPPLLDSSAGVSAPKSCQNTVTAAMAPPKIRGAAFRTKHRHNTKTARNKTGVNSLSQNVVACVYAAPELTVTTSTVGLLVRLVSVCACARLLTFQPKRPQIHGVSAAATIVAHVDPSFEDKCPPEQTPTDKMSFRQPRAQS